MFLLVVNCTSVEPEVWPGVQFAPDSSWKRVWEEVGLCTGRDVEFGRVIWKIAPDGALGEQVVARWVPPYTVFTTEWVVRTNALASIRHEAIHVQTQKSAFTEEEHQAIPEFRECDHTLESSS